MLSDNIPDWKIKKTLPPHISFQQQSDNPDEWRIFPPMSEDIDEIDKMLTKQGFFSKNDGTVRAKFS